MRIYCTGLSLSLCLALSACDSAPDEPVQAQRIDLGAAAQQSASVAVLASPDTSRAAWVVNETGQAIDYGNAGEKPMLTLDCRLNETPPQMRIIRHVQARPGKGALFPIVGNQKRSRFLVDAALSDGEWRWEGAVSAADPRLDVFTGPRQLLATLPGGGMLDIAGSHIPGEFVNWCRAGGKVMQAEDAEKDGVVRNEAGDLLEQ